MIFRCIEDEQACDTKEELEGMGAYYLLKGVPPIPPNDAQRWKLEDKVEHLGSENAKLREMKKEVMSCCQELQRDVRRL
ncbi:UNVERIFIED_CONTAM: hypothetical protein Sindi_2275800 [Sesamum indicum]